MGIKVSELAQELAQGLSEYSQEVADAIKKATDEVAEEAVQELKSTSPVLTGSYAKGWAKKNTYESKSSKRNTVYNKTDYQLTHLLEKLVYLAYRNIRKKWTMPLANWATISQQLAIKFGERFKLL